MPSTRWRKRQLARSPWGNHLESNHLRPGCCISGVGPAVYCLPPAVFRPRSPSMQTTAAPPATAEALARPRWRDRYRPKKDWNAGLWALLFLGPNLALFLVFTAYPVGYGLYLSFFNYSIIKPARYVGF